MTAKSEGLILLDWEAFYMSPESQDAIVGRSLRERKQVREQLAKLKAEAVRIGRTLHGAGIVLTSQHPEYLRFDGDSTDGRFVHSPNDLPRWSENQEELDVHNPKDINLDAIRGLVSDIRKCILEESRLSESLKDMGIDGAA